ncbi:MAG: hypothetical protein JWQ52_1540 [Phenylobacterium sp.]|nr:hypothetical protein [Phenylobacterium sp.]
MDRRACIRSAFGAAAVVSLAAGANAKAATPKTSPIVLYCDLEVDPAREQEMLDHFHNKFAPAGAKFKGFIDLKMLKLRTHIQGYDLPRSVNYRFQLTYQNEELRQIWIASKTHAALWPGIENTLTNKNFQVVLFDVV